MVRIFTVLGFVLLFGLAQKVTSQEKQVLIATSILDEPYLQHGDDGDSDKLEGFVEDLAEELQEILDVEIEIRLVKDGKYGNQGDDGQWTGMIGEILRKEAHMAIAPLTMTAARAKVIDFSAPFQEFQLSILMKEPPEEEDESDATWTFLEPMHCLVWVCLLLAILGLFFLSLIIEWTFKTVDARPAGFFNFLRQDSICRPESLTGKLLRLIFWIFVLIVVSAYAASFTAQRLADSEEPVAETIDNVDDLLEEAEELEFGIIQGGSTANYFKNSEITLYKRLFEVMSKKDTFMTNYSEGVDLAREGTFAFLIEAPKAEYFTSQQPCDLTTVGEDFGPVRGYAIATAKNSPLSDRVNLAILEMREKGVMERLEAKWWNEGQCSDEDQDEDEDEDEFDQLHLSEMAGVFYFLLIGLAVVILVWIVELQVSGKPSS